MTKRGQWVLTCVVWAAIWFVLGMILWPFLALTFVSLMMIMLPVGTPDTPTVTHNPNEWSKHSGNEPRT